MPAGYSGTPLARKLGYSDGMTVWQRGMPEAVRAEIENEAQVRWAGGGIGSPAAAHLFTTDRAELERMLKTLRDRIAPDAMVWVSWPKKASRVPTDITEDTIRAVALPMGFVDVKVCAVDAVWSGLKLVIRKELRG